MGKPKEGWNFWSFPWGEIFRSSATQILCEINFDDSVT